MLIELFTRQAAAKPKAKAVITATEELTYVALHDRARRIAHRLRELGVRRDERVAVFMDRSCDMLASLLGVWYAGGAYVPLDPEYPPDRLAYMIDDAKPVVLLTQRSLVARAPRPETHVVVLEDALRDVSTQVPQDPEYDDADDLAYVIYTSGSTGKPKGVEIPRGAIANFLESMREEPGMESDDVLVAVTTLSFDIAALELFLPLTVGATIVLASAADASDGEVLRSSLERHRATVMQATPTTWRMLLDAGWPGLPGFKALCGGEALPPDLAAELLARVSHVWNMYGPTETTVWSTCYRLQPEGPVLIGHPIRNTTVYILDKSGRPAPPGVPGEIFIGGAGVARGYRNRPDLTEERFPLDPHGTHASARMYRTGDLGRYLNDGNIEYRGRMDNQIKLRGFRIEPGEIETVLARHPSVQLAAVVLQADRPEDARLVAYLVARPNATIAVSALRDYLTDHLPAYMVPQHIVELDEMPLTPNRKIDRLQLPRVDTSAPMEGAPFVAPASDTEIAVAQIWKTVIGVDRVSADASFFDLGGHSILATRIVAHLKRDYAVGLTLRHLFETPTVRGLALQIDALRHVSAPLAAAENGSRAREEFAF